MIKKEMLTYPFPPLAVQPRSSYPLPPSAVQPRLLLDCARKINTSAASNEYLPDEGRHHGRCPPKQSSSSQCQLDWHSLQIPSVQRNITQERGGMRRGG